MAGTEVFGGSTVDIWWAATDSLAPVLAATNPVPDPSVWSAVGGGYIDEDGFNVDFQNTINKVFVLRSTAPQRVYRTQEEPMITFNLFDGTAEGMGVSMHGTDQTVGGVISNPSTGSGGDYVKRINIMRGPRVRDAAILWRTASPTDTDPDSNEYLLQGYIPRGVFTQVGSFKFYKEQITLPLTFEALESTNSTLDDLERLGWIDVQGELQ